MSISCEPIERFFHICDSGYIVDILKRVCGFFLGYRVSLIKLSMWIIWSWPRFAPLCHFAIRCYLLSGFEYVMGCVLSVIFL